MPEFPDGLSHYLRMDVSGLPPSLYWEQSIEDFEMATAVQAAYREGQDEAVRASKDAAEHEQKSRDMHKQLKAKAGM